MEDRDKKTELLVGLFLTVGLAMMGVLILQFGSVKDLFKGSYTLTVSFPDASGIKENSPVVLAGKRIGKVKGKPDHNETYTGVIIQLEIFEGEKIPVGSKFTISTAGLMGDAFINIKPPVAITDQFISTDLPNLIVGETGGGLSDLQSGAERIGKQVSDILENDVRPALKEFKDTVAKVRTDALSDDTLGHFNKGMEKLESALTRVDEKMLDEENAASLKKSLADIKEAAASFKAGAKSFDDGAKKLGPMIDKLDPAIAKVESVVTGAGDAMKSFKSGADNFAAFTRKLNTSDGLLHALMTDPQLKDNFKDLISNMRKSGPVFYKDKAAKEEAEQQQQQTPPQKKPGIFNRSGR